MKHVDYDSVRVFWAWFVENEERIILAVSSFETKWLHDELTAKMKQLAATCPGPRLNWEIGPGSRSEWQFVLSPGVRENLPVSRAIVAAAPPLKRWEFHAAKPPKPGLALQIEMVVDEVRSTSVDASGWGYLLRRETDGTLGILIAADCLPSMTQEDKQRAAYLLIENLLGEEFVMEYIGQAALVEASSVPPHVPLSRIENLRTHLEGLLGKNATTPENPN